MTDQQWSLAQYRDREPVDPEERERQAIVRAVTHSILNPLFGEDCPHCGASTLEWVLLNKELPNYCGMCRYKFRRESR